jgi:hypothetical protein
MAARTKRSRRIAEPDASTTISLSSELRKRVDAWAAKQSDRPARSEAMLRLLELGLQTSGSPGGLILVRCSLGEARAFVGNSVSSKFGELCVDLADALHKFLLRQISIGMFPFKLEMSGISEATRRLQRSFAVLHPRAREKTCRRRTGRRRRR